MSKENDLTVKVYEKKASVYLKTTIEHDNLDLEKAKRKRKKLNDFIKINMELLPKNSKVLEIGSADGVNAAYIKELGYNITASDIANDFLNEIKNKGLNPIKFNILEDEITEKYSAIFAWRVFVHFTKDDIVKVFEKVHDALENDGIFVFNMMNREIKKVDNEWVDFPNEYQMGAERFYQYFSENEINELINKKGFKIYSFHKEGGENNNKWLVYVLKKK